MEPAILALQADPRSLRSGPEPPRQLQCRQEEQAPRGGALGAGPAGSLGMTLQGTHGQGPTHTLSRACKGTQRGDGACPSKDKEDLTALNA